MSSNKTEDKADKDANITIEQNQDITHTMKIPANTVVAYQVMELLINNTNGILNFIF